jgi:hypothetical protein
MPDSQLIGQYTPGCRLSIADWVRFSAAWVGSTTDTVPVHRREAPPDPAAPAAGRLPVKGAGTPARRGDREQVDYASPAARLEANGPCWRLIRPQQSHWPAQSPWP